jgi:hypothetical protein
VPPCPRPRSFVTECFDTHVHARALLFTCAMPWLLTCTMCPVVSVGVAIQLGVVFKGRPRLIVLELLDVPNDPITGKAAGPALGDYLMCRRHHTHEENELVALMKMSEMVCRGLQYCHSRGVIHCDIAARNVLVDAHVSHGSPCFTHTHARARGRTYTRTNTHAHPSWRI